MKKLLLALRAKGPKSLGLFLLRPGPQRLGLFLLAAGAQLNSMACPTCEIQQPRLLRGVIHGPGPEHAWEYGFFFLAILIFVLTLFFSVKWLIHPGEPASNHIKHFILNEECF